MTDDEGDHLPRVLVVCGMIVVILTGCVISFLPREFAVAMVAWLLLSITVGVSFGHCVLNEP